MTATFLLSPWMLNYDMVVFGFIVALSWERTDNTPADHILALAVWVLPLALLLFGVANIPIAMLVLPAFAGRLIWRLACAELPHRRCGKGACHANRRPAAAGLTNSRQTCLAAPSCPPI